MTTYKWTKVTRWDYGPVAIVQKENEPPVAFYSDRLGTGAEIDLELAEAVAKKLREIAEPVKEY